MQEIKEDILKLSPEDFYKKYILKSCYWYFSDYMGIDATELTIKIDIFKEIVSDILDINFHNTQLVGSAKTGFSLSPNQPLRKFDEINSDLDIAIISNELFSEFWNDLREKYQYGLMYKRIYHSVYMGYINIFDCINHIYIKEKMSNKFDQINKTLQDKFSIIHPIHYRVYRSWDDLSDYQIDSIKKTKAKLESEV